MFSFGWSFVRPFPADTFAPAKPFPERSTLRTPEVYAISPPKSETYSMNVPHAAAPETPPLRAVELASLVATAHAIAFLFAPSLSTRLSKLALSSSRFEVARTVFV
eukprot:GHVL01022735.1.p6 GENE.GHVL01022735.1~~GHVL01022735.1.p6  ORF type:complete len:106 (+),score=6.17 GHVL01022735.1:1227-1544(+)